MPRIRAISGKAFPPFSTVQYYFYRWRNDCLQTSINHRLVMVGRDPYEFKSRPVCGVTATQPVNTTYAGGSRKRCDHEVDQKLRIPSPSLTSAGCSSTLSCMLRISGWCADDPTLIRHAFPWVRHGFANARDKLKSTLVLLGSWAIRIIKCPDFAGRFQQLSRSWVVERTIVCWHRGRRLATGFKAFIEAAIRPDLHHFRQAVFGSSCAGTRGRKIMGESL